MTRQTKFKRFNELCLFPLTFVFFIAPGLACAEASFFLFCFLPLCVNSHPCTMSMYGFEKNKFKKRYFTDMNFNLVNSVL